MALQPVARITLALAAVVGSAVFAAPAGAVFTAPADLTVGGSNPQVATDATGDSAVAWEFTGNRVQARTVSSTGVLGPVHELGQASGTTDFGVRAAIDSQGDAIFAWTRSTPGSFVLARPLSAAGVLGQLVQLSGNSGSFNSIDVASDLNGDSVFTWVNIGGGTQPRIQARTMSTNGTLSPIRNVSPLNQTASSPQVATDASGDTVLTWVREDNADGDNDVVQGRIMSVNGSLGPSFDVSNPNGRAFAPLVATDTDGDTTFAWNRFDGTRDRIQVRHMTPAGTLGTITSLFTGGASGIAPQLATDSTGDSVVTWERADGGFDRAQARTFSLAGALGPLTNLSGTGGDAFATRVASAASGASAFAWLRSDGTADRVQARTMTAAGAFGSVADLSAAGTDAEAPQIAMGANSASIVAVWERAGTIQVTRGP